jgi:hypothetical protein
LGWALTAVLWWWCGGVVQMPDGVGQLKQWAESFKQVLPEPSNREEEREEDSEEGGVRGGWQKGRGCLSFYSQTPLHLLPTPLQPHRPTRQWGCCHRSAQCEAAHTAGQLEQMMEQRSGNPPARSLALFANACPPCGCDGALAAGEGAAGLSLLPRRADHPVCPTTPAPGLAMDAHHDGYGARGVGGGGWHTQERPC